MERVVLIPLLRIKLGRYFVLPHFLSLIVVIKLKFVGNASDNIDR